MKKIILITGLFLGLSAQAAKERIDCTISEFMGGKHINNSVTVLAENDPHGALITFNGSLFPEISGFVSLLQNDDKFFAVLSIYSEKSASNSSGQYQMVANEQYAQIQLVMPSSSSQLSGVEILCQFFKE